MRANKSALRAELAGGLSEMKIDAGPGYRVDYTLRGDQLVLLLVGGEKSSQSKDIELAKRLLDEQEG
jgi:putative addiction module killer protein